MNQAGVGDHYGAGRQSIDHDFTRQHLRPEKTIRSPCGHLAVRAGHHHQITDLATQAIRIDQGNQIGVLTWHRHGDLFIVIVPRDTLGACRLKVRVEVMK